MTSIPRHSAGAIDDSQDLKRIEQLSRRIEYSMLAVGCCLPILGGLAMIMASLVGERSLTNQALLVFAGLVAGLVCAVLGISVRISKDVTRRRSTLRK